MKRLIVIALLLVSAQAVFGQYYFQDNVSSTKSQLVSFQVAPTVVYFDGIKYGVGIGLDIKQVLSVNYFHARDYGVNESIPYLDNRFAGFHINLAVPLLKKIQLAVGARKGTLNNHSQKAIFTGEIRYKLNQSSRLALEFGGNSKYHLNAVKWIVNL